MDVGADFSGIKLIRKKSRLAEQKVERHPDFAVKLIDVLEILPDIFPKGLFDIQCILSALVTIHAV